MSGPHLLPLPSSSDLGSPSRSLRQLPDSEKRGHICPPSSAVHPRDRWETVFVYSFIRRFITDAKDKGPIQGLESPMDFEDALLSTGPHPILEQILTRFVKNLRPKKGSGPTESISHTVSVLFGEFMRLPERSTFWDETLRANVNPLAESSNGFFSESWDIKLRVLRQLVEWQLAHNQIIRGKLDVAWGVKHVSHKKKTADTPQMPPPPPPEHPDSREKLSFLPLGQDSTKRRYWVVDDSPRLYVSSNPWKVSATFETVASTKEEYLKIIEALTQFKPVDKPGVRMNKFETFHLELITKLQARVNAIDAESNRIEKLRKKAEREAMLAAHAAEVRGTRSRRQTHRPDYIYNDGASEDEGDEYNDTYQDEEEDEEQEQEQDFGSGSASGSAQGRRRSTRSTVLNSYGKRPAVAEETEWRGERRSLRLGGAAIEESEPIAKRARTSSSTPGTPSFELAATGAELPVEVKKRVVKRNEAAVDAVPGKKKSKYWFYAVDPKNPQAQSATQDAEGPQEPNGGAVEEKSTETSVEEAGSPFPFNRSRKNGKRRLPSSEPTSVEHSDFEAK